MGKFGLWATIGVAFIVLGIVSWRTARPLDEIGKDTAPPIDFSSVVDDDSKTVELSWFGPPNYATGKMESYPQQVLEKRFNVKLKPVFIDAMAYQRRRPLMFAGGSIPDVCWVNDPNVLQRDVNNGFYVPVPYDLIRKYAPHYMQYQNEIAPIGWLYAQVNGKNYGVPTCFLPGMYSVPGMWRADWLRKVGITKVPETLDEMHEALKRFRYNDPDDNGKRDTYGMSGDIQSWWWTSFGDIFGAYGVTPFDWQLDSKGEVVWGGITPEAKQALALLRKWYDEGLIDPEFVTDKMDSNGTLMNKFTNGKLGYVYYMGRYFNVDPKVPTSMINTMKKLNPRADLAPGRFVIGPTGKRGGRVWGPGGNIIAFGPGVREHPEKLIRALKMIDGMSSDIDLYIKVSTGEFDTHWVFKDPKIGPHSGMIMKKPYDDPNVARQNLVSVGNSFFAMAPTKPGAMDMYAQREDIEFRDEYQRPEWALVDLLGKPDVVPSAGDYLVDLQNMEKTAFAQIISGQKPLEYFDQFVKDWLKYGGEKLTKEAAALQKAKLDIYRQAGVPEANWR